MLRLGFSHGNDEIISRAQAIEWFNLESINKSAARLDLNKLFHLNAHYIKHEDNKKLYDMVCQMYNEPIPDAVLEGMSGLKQRAKTLKELYENATFYWKRPEMYDAPCTEPLLLRKYIEEVDLSGSEEELQNKTRTFAENNGMKLGDIAQPLRYALTGKKISPSVFEIMAILKADEVKERIQAYIEF